MHRSELLTKKNILKKIIKDLNIVSDKLKIKIYFPCHPRTMKIIKNLNIKLNKNFKITKPIGYDKFLKILISSSIVLSGFRRAARRMLYIKKKTYNFKK